MHIPRFSHKCAVPSHVAVLTKQEPLPVEHRLQEGLSLQRYKSRFDIELSRVSLLAEADKIVRNEQVYKLDKNSNSSEEDCESFDDKPFKITPRVAIKSRRDKRHGLLPKIKIDDPEDSIERPISKRAAADGDTSTMEDAKPRKMYDKRTIHSNRRRLKPLKKQEITTTKSEPSGNKFLEESKLLRDEKTRNIPNIPTNLPTVEVTHSEIFGLTESQKQRERISEIVAQAALTLHSLEQRRVSLTAILSRVRARKKRMKLSRGPLRSIPENETEYVNPAGVLDVPQEFTNQHRVSKFVAPPITQSTFKVLPIRSREELQKNMKERLMQRKLKLLNRPAGQS